MLNHNQNSMLTTTETEDKTTWTTWEELLLACAVKRHGLKDWDSVAMELQSRSSLSVLLNAHNCKNKYHDLKRRFMDTNDDEPDSIPWLEDLRKLRVAELKQEVHRYDLSITSLQLKVKRLQEEREQSLKENENGDEKPDLDNNLKQERSENDKTNEDEPPQNSSPEEVVLKTVSGKESDRENRSFNESNSTENRGNRVKTEPEPVETGDVKPDLDTKLAREDSCNDSSDTITRNVQGKSNQDRRINCDSAELRDSVAESKEGSQGTKESSDAQSSASLTKKSRRSKSPGGDGGDGDDPVVVSAPTVKEGSVKSEPLVGLLDIIRSHKHALAFEGQLENQKTDEYKNLIRDHVDLETVKARIDNGSYSSCTTKFYVDMLLVFNNAIVFFPATSKESVAAYELRDLVLKELRKQRSRQPTPPPESAQFPQQPKPDTEKSDSLLAQHKSSAPIIVCRKRSSIAAKSLSTIKTEKQTDQKPVVNPRPPVKSSSTANEEESSMKQKTNEKAVTGSRSMRRNIKSRTNRTDNAQNKNQNTNSGSSFGSKDEGQPSMGEKKTTDVTITVKKSGAADFLKRMKSNSPAKGTLLETWKNPMEDGNGSGKRDQQKKRLDEQKDGTVRRSSGGRRVKEESTPSKRSVGRPPKKGKDSVPAKHGRREREVEVTDKRHRKRCRR